MAFVYVLRCRDGSFYTGVAKNLETRLRQHQAGRGSRYTRARLPVTLLWSREVATWGGALREERRIKRLRRRDKEAFLATSRGLSAAAASGGRGSRGAKPPAGSEALPPPSAPRSG